MKLKYYMGLVLIIIIALGIYLYGFSPENLSLTQGSDTNIIALPRSIWLAITLGILAAFGIVFFIIDWIRSKIASFQEQRDFMRLISQILEQIGKDNYTPAIYNNKNFLILSKILRRFQLQPKLNTQNSGLSKIDQLFDILGQIDLGYEQDLRKYGFSKDNPYVIKNLINKTKKEYKIGFMALSDPEITPENKKIIFLKILEKCNAKEIKKLLESTTFMDQEMFFKTIDTLKSYQMFLPEADLIAFCRKAKLTENDYVRLAKSLKGFLEPDIWVKFFENLAIADEKAELSFLYVLCDLELNNQVLQRLTSMGKDEFLNIRAYMDLRSQGKHYPLELFIFNTKEIK